MRVNPTCLRAYTMVELLMVVACIAVAALLIMPSLSSAQGVQLRGAADAMLADMEYAQAQSLGAGDDPIVVMFDVPQNRYWLAKKSSPSTPITHPVDKNPYSNVFGAGRLATMRDVKLDSTALEGGGNSLEFGPLGSVKGATVARITLRAKGGTIAIEFDPATGDASVGNIK